MIQMHQLRIPRYLVISDFGSALQAIIVRESELSFFRGSYDYPNISHKIPYLSDRIK